MGRHQDRNAQRRDEKRKGTHYRPNSKSREPLPPLEWKALHTFQTDQVELILQVAHGKTKTFHSFRIQKRSHNPERKPSSWIYADHARDVEELMRQMTEYLKQPVLPTAESTLTDREIAEQNARLRQQKYNDIEHKAAEYEEYAKDTE